jgi:hypothetical protein
VRGNTASHAGKPKAGPRQRPPGVARRDQVPASGRRSI